MKVSFLAGTLGLGGAEKQLFFMLRAARELGISLSVLCLTKNEAFQTKIESLDIPVTWVGKHESRFRRLVTIIRRLKQEQPDIIQSSHFYTNIYAGAAGRILGKKSIGAVRSDLRSEIAEHGFLGRWQMRLPEFLITNSSVATRNAIKRGFSEEKIATVRNVVDRPKSRGSTTNDRPLTFLFAGRLDELKRPDKFVDLAAVLLEKHRSIQLRFMIAGDGSLRSKLEDQAVALGIGQKQLQFLGACGNMTDIYNKSDVLISTSVREGTSNVILEAMSHSIPVVATKIGGTPELLADDRGILIKADDRNELISAAEKLMFSPELRKNLGALGRLYVDENHSLKYLQNQLSGIYKRLNGQRI
ncbi:MAG: glycosyltransferase family 4 protein [Pyrinomonadaceae bacterium]|nr:glycosyltransferase family 4 protein [Pyrinomonadaceae bacterium]